MNSVEEKIFGYLEASFWDKKLKYNSSDEVLKEIVGSSQDCPKEVKSLIDRCLKLSTMPTEGEYFMHLADLKKRAKEKSQDTKISQDAPFKESIQASMTKRAENFANLDLNQNEKILVEYLQQNFWDQKNEYSSASDLIERKFYDIKTEDMNPEILSFMDRLIKNPSLFGSEDEYQKSIVNLIKTQKILLPSPSKYTQKHSQFGHRQNYLNSEKRARQPYTQPTELNTYDQPSKDYYRLNEEENAYNYQTRSGEKNLYTNPADDNSQLSGKKTNLISQAQGNEKYANTVKDIPINNQKSKILHDAEFLVEYREIEIADLKNLIIDFINTFTDIELTMPYEGMLKYSPVEKINVNDELGLWSYDHFQGCMNIWLQRSRGVLPKSFTIEKDFFKKNPEVIKFTNYTECAFQQDKQLNKNSVSLHTFLLEVADVNQKDRSFADKWLKALNENHADRLEEILAWDEHDWSSARLEVNAIKLIRNQLNQFRFKSNQNEGMKKLTKSEKYAVIHRIKRFLTWKTQPATELEAIEYLDEKALFSGFQEVREKYVGEPLLKQLETFYESFTIAKSYSESLIMNRGMLLYGPPGTGKTVLTDILPSKIGLTPISYPLCASEVNRSLVGQTEKLLLELVSRAKKIPYLLCCLAIDEIDGLAPKRDGNSSQHKVDALAVLLSVIGGIKDVSNLMFLASTNRLNQMDDAFKRRMSGQFFVGRPSPAARQAIIKASKATYLSSKMIDQVVILSTNFSGAALKQYISYIISEARKLNRYNNTTECLPYNVLADIAAKTSKQFNIRLGNYSLPELFLLQKQKENPITTSFLKLLEDQQVIFILKENLVEIKYRRFRMENPTLDSTKPQKIFELEHVDLVVDKSISDNKKFIESLLLSRQDNDTKKRIEVETFNILGATRLTEEYISSLFQQKVYELESRAEKNKQKDFVLLWPDIIERSNQGDLNRELPDVAKKWFLSNSERIASVKNLYHFFITSEANYDKLYNMISWKLMGSLNKKEIKFSGRILVDLSEEDPELRFELDEKADTYRLYSESLLMEKSVTNSSQVIPKLVEFASERGIDFILLMDQDFLLANNAFDETKIKENITEKMQEFNSYEKSLLIVDVDSLVGMVKSVNESSMGISNSYSLSDSKLYSMIIHYARSLPKLLSSSEYWVALISKNKELSNMIKHDLSWPMTIDELNKREEEEKDKEPRPCLRCNEIYTEDKNDFNNCSYHDGDLFEVSASYFHWKLLDEEEAQKLFLLGTVTSKLEPQNQGKQIKEPQFLHICCLQPLKSPGCKKQKHICEIEILTNEKGDALEKYAPKLEEYRSMFSKTQKKAIEVKI